MTGVAVLAKDTWSAKKGRDALSVVWDDSAAFRQAIAQAAASASRSQFSQLFLTGGVCAPRWRVTPDAVKSHG